MPPANPIAFSTPANASAWQRWAVFSPAARIVFFFAALCLLMLITGDVLSPLLAAWAPSGSAWREAIALSLYRIVPAVLAYEFLVHAIERRPMVEMRLRDAPWGGTLGILSGAALFSFVVLVLWCLGSYHVTGTNGDAHWLTGILVTGLGAGVSEEIITRGVLFRIIEEGLGTWWALGISALFFGFAHILNPGATVWAAVAIAIEAGVLFGLLYHLTRSLWPCIGLHAAWNVMQGTFFGIPVSGTDAHGWLVAERTGPDWLSGGVFGAEASVVALLVCSACSVLLLIVALRRGSIVPPAWHRTATGAA